MLEVWREGGMKDGRLEGEMKERWKAGGRDEKMEGVMEGWKDG